MAAKKITYPPARQTGFGATLARFVGKGRSRDSQRLDSLRKVPLLHRFAPRKMIKTPDPVSLAIFVIDRVGPAAVRAARRVSRFVAPHRTRQPPRYCARR
jgi:hypothetical protein